MTTAEVTASPPGTGADDTTRSERAFVGKVIQFKVTRDDHRLLFRREKPQLKNARFGSSECGLFMTQEAESGGHT